MLQFLLSGLRFGIRGRSFQAVIVLGILMVAMAYLSGSFSPRQPRTVALDIGFSGIRLSLILLNLLWVQELVAREIDRRTILFSLAYPLSRTAFLLGRFGAVLILSFLAALVLGLLLTAAVIQIGGGYDQEFQPKLGLPFWATMAGLVIDAAIVAAFALCIATISTVSVLPLALGAAFAVAGKALGATLDYLAAGADGDTTITERFGPAVNLIRWLLPDLSRLDWRDWSLYGVVPPEGALFWSTGMALAYSALLILFANLLFIRREFS